MSLGSASTHDVSPFEGLPYQLAREGTTMMIKNALKDKGSDEDKEESPSGQRPRRRRFGYIEDVRIDHLFGRAWHLMCEGFRANRYRLPAAIYLILFTAIFLTAFINIIMATLRGFEAGQPKITEMKGGQCEEGFQSARAYRVLFEGVTSVLPHLVSLTLFLFPALYRS